MISVELTALVKKDFSLNQKRFKKNVGIAAAITAKARIKLFNAQKDVVKNEGRLLYSDTDSIFAAYKKNVINEKHGEVF
jgi:DNA polymerase elongation subunit (family B)